MMTKIVSDDNRFFGDPCRAFPTHLLSKENVDVLKFFTTCVLEVGFGTYFDGNSPVRTKNMVGKKKNP